MRAAAERQSGSLTCKIQARLKTGREMPEKRRLRKQVGFERKTKA